MTYPCVAPPKPERRLVRKELAEPEHHTVNEWQEQVDRGAAKNGPDSGRLVENDGRGRRGRR